MYQAPGSSASPSITEGQPEAFWQNKTNGVRQLPGAYAASNNNAFPPSCVAEKFTLPNASWQLGTPYTSTNSVTVAHVTAHGYGANRNTVVALESYYAM